MNDDLTYSPPKPGKMPMFGSLHVELPVESLMQSKHIYQGSIAIDTENYRADSIKLEYLANNRMGKRSSFLLTNFDEDSILPMKKLSSFTYEGATISKVDDPNNQPDKRENILYGKQVYRGIQSIRYGRKRYPHGVIYDGYFNRNGDFHGTGMLINPAGHRVEELWRNGKLVQGANCLTIDNPERRLLIDYTEVPKPKLVVETLDEEKSITYDLLMQNSPSQELLLNSLRWNLIPRPQKIDSVPAQEIEQWIKYNCRKSWDESTGYRGDLYEVWTAGYREESLACTDQLKAMNSLDESNEIAKTSLLENVDLLPSDPAVPSRNKYSKMYSFILHHTQNIEKYIHDGRKCSYLNLSHMFVPVSSPHDLPKRKEIHLQRRSKNPKSRASSAPGSPKLKSGTYGLKYLLKHHQIQKKKSGVRVENDLIDDFVAYQQRVKR
ncbi:uncharacterized protein LOC109540799 isoform X2 [Dendroctonus ponderosae]|uniref:MORN repeat-containing protein 5 n=1 Tax=Dendroctonus ponderosae TaxID=77166 RepID=U4ULI6_DENPD|nr:uncharacterized protein LOC109540799 isoform X2 [Dendroctonus ponderosae]ERL94934.1 hypothetical protein D910_12206 [Dendroctonus ponderosae]KAH1028329.1 hypothetical protein HUJ05_001691 [Dendroctonus ponderosae]